MQYGDVCDIAINLENTKILLTGQEKTNVIEIDIDKMQIESSELLHPSIKVHTHKHSSGAPWG